MSLPDLTGQNIENTYQRLVQTDGTNFYDGTGSVVNFGVNPFPYTGSAIITGSLEVIGPFTASGFNYPTIAGNEGETIVIDQDGNLNFAYPKAITERVKNVSGGQLPKGTPVHATGSGTSGNIVGIIAADAGDPTKMPATYVLNETLDDESEGEALAVGYIQGVNTTGLIEGEVVYVAVGGGWTQTKPTGSALIQNLGIVTKVGSNGSGVVLGAGRSNDLPNIQSGYTWVGNFNGVPTAVPTASLFNISTSSFITTSSFNNFTQSYYTDSASFDTRINNITVDTSSLVTTSSFNTFTLSINTFTSSIQTEVDNLTAETGSYATTGSNQFSGNQIITGNTRISGSLIVTGSITGSLFGTASWAVSSSRAISSSIALTASFLPVGTYNITSSWAQSSSNAISAQTASTVAQSTINDLQFFNLFIA